MTRCKGNGRAGKTICASRTRAASKGHARAIEARSPAIILLHECALATGGAAQQRKKPTLWAAATSLAECAPLVVVGSAEHQMELGALLAAGDVDFVVCSDLSLQVAVGWNGDYDSSTYAVRARRHRGTRRRIVWKANRKHVILARFCGTN